MSILAAAISFFVLAQDLERKITLEIPAMPVSAALDQLSTASGVRLIHSSVTGPLIMTASFKGCTVKAAMDKIAWAAHAEWVPESGMLLLTRTPEIERITKDQIFAARKAFAKKVLDKLKLEIAKEASFNPTEASALAILFTELQKSAHERKSFDQSVMSKLRAKTPIERAARRIAALITAEQLAGISSSGREVFTSTPNRMQERLTSDPAPILKAMVESQSLMVKEVAKAGFDPKQENWPWESLSINRETLLPAKTLVACTQNGSRGFMISIKFADSKGRVISSPVVLLSDGANPRKEIFFTDSTGKRLTPTLVLDELSKALRQSGAVAYDFKKLSPEALELIRQTDKFEPQETLIAPMLREAADERGCSMVAILPDIACGAVFWMARTEPTSQKLMQTMSVFGMEVQDKEKWLTLRPEDPFEAEAAQVDRKDLAKVAARIIGGSLPSLEERVRIAQTPLYGETNLYQSWGGLLGNLIYPDERMPLRLYGSFDANQRLTLTHGGHIPYGRMREDQKRLFDQVVFGRSDGPTLIHAHSDDPIAAEGDSLLFEGTLLQEPTEALPSAIPSDSALRMDLKISEAIFGVAKPGRMERVVDNSLLRQPLAAGEIAWRIYANERPDAEGLSGTRTVIEGFRHGTHLTAEMTMTFSALLSYRANVEHADYDPKSALIPMSKLPEKMQKEVDEILKSYRDPPLRTLGLKW